MSVSRLSFHSTSPNWMAVSREVEQSSQKVGGLILGSSSRHVEVSLGKILNRELAPIPLALKSTSFTWL